MAVPSIEPQSTAGVAAASTGMNGCVWCTCTKVCTVAGPQLQWLSVSTLQHVGMHMPVLQRPPMQQDTPQAQRSMHSMEISANPKDVSAS